MAQLVTTTTSSPKRVTAIDEVDASTTYLGFAKLGVATSEAKWQVLRIQKTGTVTLIQYADGDTRFNNVWDDRASLTYSN